MLNTQSPLSPDRDDDGFLKVHSIFKTIQGEGPFAGSPALFIRLYGCNLQCPFCDTDYTSERQEFSPTALMEVVTKTWPIESNNPLVVITGGEPFRQNVVPFTWKLLEAGYSVQFETNGVFYPGDDFPWLLDRVTVVCSPKTGKIHPKTALLVTAYKYVLSHDAVGPDGLPETALSHPLGGLPTVARPPKGWAGPVYLNPMDAKDPKSNERNHAAVAKSVMENSNYVMGVQLHKIVGLP